MGRGETRVRDSEGVRREKVKGREKKWEILQWVRNLTKIIFIGDVTCETEIVF